MHLVCTLRKFSINSDHLKKLELIYTHSIRTVLEMDELFLGSQILGFYHSVPLTFVESGTHHVASLGLPHLCNEVQQLTQDFFRFLDFMTLNIKWFQN